MLKANHQFCEWLAFFRVINIILVKTFRGLKNVNVYILVIFAYQTKIINNMKRNLALLSVFLLFISVGWAQVTTSTLKGLVKDNDGPMMGAEVLVVHVPTGTKTGTITQENGRFILPNLRIGGPYKVVIKFVGYQPVELDNIFLKLGEAKNIEVVLHESKNALKEVVIKVKDNGQVSAKDKNGPVTSIGHRELETLPTISRSAEDFYRLEPSASGNSFGGRNDQYNNFSLNGTIFNNPFGLDAATPGGQSNAQPISLDAIDQIQVSTAPYDVTQSGFTGAAVNAVTKSGTNTFHGTVFGYYRNQDMTGKVNLGNTTLTPDLKQLQGGFSIGGPIIKNKLFFFVNAEIDDRSDLGSFYIANAPGRSGDNVSRVEKADLELVSSLLKNMGYETGPYEGYLHDTYSQKGIIKLDWNATDNLRLSFIYNRLNAYRDLNAHPEAIKHRGPDRTVMQFYNSGYRINNNIDSYLTEINWNSKDGKMSNKFQAGYTFFDDYRDPKSTPAPPITITKDDAPYIIVGHEPFSIHNNLTQKVYQASDIFTYNLNNHTITTGFSFEKFSFVNSFNLFGYSKFGLKYGSPFAQVDIQDFVNDATNTTDLQQAFAYAQQAEAADKWNITKLDVGQLGFFAQDEIQVNDYFKFAFGLRVDKPMYFDTDKYVEEKIKEAGTDYIMEDLTWYDENGKPLHYSARNLPSDKLLWSPRLSFNWDVSHDNTAIIRGGTGVFTGRLPFVWIGNHIANVGRWYMTPVSPDFKFPQVWRTSIGADNKWGKGWSTSIDLAYTKDINAMMVRDYGLKPPTGTLNSSIDPRPVYTYADRVTMQDGFFAGIPADLYTFTNTDLGDSFNFTVKVNKNFKKGLHTSLAYNFMVANDANSIEAEITGDAFLRNPALGNVNVPKLAPSLYGDKHRIVGFTSKEWRYGDRKQWNTTIAAVYEWAKGGRFSYTYAGDINGDGSNLNDLIYIPTEDEINQMYFNSNVANPQLQRDAFNHYILQDDYLSSHRGEYMERYAILSPWRSKIDLKLTQSYRIKGAQKVQFNLNILNLGNLLNSDWGVVKLPNTKQPVGVSFTDENGDPVDYPVYTFDPNLKSTFYNDYSLRSRWQIQAGLRYIF